MTRFHRLELDPRQRAPSAATAKPAASASSDPDALQEADQHRRGGRFEESLRCYSRALEFDRSIAVAWLGQVQMLIELEEYPEAELWSRKALELFRDNGDLMASRAQALCRIGEVHQAQPLSDAALAQRDQSAYRWLVRGEIMLRRKEAMEQHCFDKAQLLDPDWLILLETARIYMHHRRPANALVRVRIAAERAPQEAYCWYLKGCIEADLGFIPAARLSLERCLGLSPKHTQARDRLQHLKYEGRGLSRVWSWLRPLRS